MYKYKLITILTKNMIDIKDILKLQKTELEFRLSEKYIPRETDTSKMNFDLIKVIIGPRKSGKSFFAFNFLKNKGEYGYVNFDDERLIVVENYDAIIEAMKSVYGTTKLVFFDEIQNLPKWELFANRLHRQGYNLVISGSNANLLSEELATHLTGRHMPIHIFPFSFREFLGNNFESFSNEEIKTKLNEYLEKGGYPEPIIKKQNIAEYLQVLYDSTIYKDIVKRYNIRQPKEIEELSFYLVSNIGSEYSYNSLSKNLKIHPLTIKKYTGYLEKSFLFFSLNQFSYKIKNQISENKKIYCIDNGLIYSKGFQFKENLGKLYENCIAIELKKLEFEGKIHLYYWKNQQGYEVDFAIKKGLKIDELFQVCYDLSKKETLNREIRGLLYASKDLKCSKLTIINKDLEKTQEIKWFGMKKSIKFIPIHKWLIQNKA